MSSPPSPDGSASSTRSPLDQYVVQLHQQSANTQLNEDEKKYLTSCFSRNSLVGPALWAVATAMLVRRGFAARARPVHPGLNFGATVFASGVAFSVASDYGRAKCMAEFAKQRDFPMAAVMRQGMRIMTQSSLEDKFPGLLEHDRTIIENMYQQEQKRRQQSQQQIDQAEDQIKQTVQKLEDNLRQLEAKTQSRPLTTYERNKQATSSSSSTDASSDAIPVTPLPRYDRDQSSVDQLRGRDEQVNRDRLWDRDRDRDQRLIERTAGFDAQIGRDQIWQPDQLPATSTIPAPTSRSTGNSWDRIRAQRHAASTNVSRDNNHQAPSDNTIPDTWSDVDVDLETATTASKTTPITTASTTRKPKLRDQPAGRMKKNEFGEEVWVEDDAS